MSGDVIFVDDEPLVARLYGRAIEAAGWSVAMKQSAGDALDEIARDGARLVISDMQMPGMSGLEFIAELKGRQMKSMPCLFMSAAKAAEIMPDALAAGADDFLPKGSPFGAIVGRVRFWLESRVPGLPDDARWAARKRLPQVNYPDDPLFLIDFPRRKLVDRAVTTMTDLLYDVPANFGAAGTDRERFLGVLSAVLTILGRNDPLSYVRRGDILMSVIDRLPLPWRRKLHSDELPRLLDIVHGATYKHAALTLRLRP